MESYSTQHVLLKPQNLTPPQVEPSQLHTKGPLTESRLRDLLALLGPDLHTVHVDFETKGVDATHLDSDVVVWGLATTAGACGFVDACLTREAREYLHSWCRTVGGWCAFNTVFDASWLRKE